MKSVEAEVCRLCGELQIIGNFRMTIKDDCGGVIFKKCIEYYCRLPIDDSLAFPQQVCSGCVSMIQNFIYFCNHVEKIQRKLLSEKSVNDQNSSKDTSEITNLEADSEVSKETNDDGNFSSEEMDIDDTCNESLLVERESEDRSSVSPSPLPRNPRKKYGPPQSWLKLYSEEIENPDSYSFAELRVPHSAIAKDGEIIDIKSLPESKTWHDLVFCCTDCRMKFESLTSLLTHLKEEVPMNKGNSWAIKCPDCWKELSRPQFLNHAVKHHEVLKFTCICCSKIYQNSLALLKHYESQHHDEPNWDIIFCLCCGMYFTSIATLKNHISTEHKSKKVKKVEVIKRPLRRGKPKGLTKNLLECRRESLKRLEEYKKRTERERNGNHEESGDQEGSYEPSNSENRSMRSSLDSNFSNNFDFEEKRSIKSSVSEDPLAIPDAPDPLLLPEKLSETRYNDFKEQIFSSSSSKSSCTKFKKPENNNKSEKKQRPCPKSKKRSSEDDDDDLNLSSKSKTNESLNKSNSSFNKPCPLSKKPKISLEGTENGDDQSENFPKNSENLKKSLENNKTSMNFSKNLTKSSENLVENYENSKKNPENSSKTYKHSGRKSENFHETSEHFKKLENSNKKSEKPNRNLENSEKNSENSIRNPDNLKKTSENSDKNLENSKKTSENSNKHSENSKKNLENSDLEISKKSSENSNNYSINSKKNNEDSNKSSENCKTAIKNYDEIFLNICAEPLDSEPEVIQKKLALYVKNKKLANFIKHDGKFLVQRSDNGAWSWLAGTKTLLKKKPVGKKITQRRMTCQ